MDFKTLIFIFLLTILVLFRPKKKKIDYTEKNAILSDGIDEIIEDEQKDFERTNPISKIEEPAKASANTIEYVLPKYNLPRIETIKSTELRNFILNNKDDKYHITIGECSNEKINCSLVKLPNILIGGTVMSGKTTLIYSIILQLLFKLEPSDLKFIILDSSRVNYGEFNGIPHLLWPVITNLNKGICALQKVVSIIEQRYLLLQEKNVKNIDEYNENSEKNISRLVIIIDELGQFSLNNDLNNFIEIIAQKGWVVGIHLIIVANQINNKILSDFAKANIPSRICFRTNDSKTSRNFMDSVGAESLETPGFMLYKSNERITPLKLKGINIEGVDIKNTLNEILFQNIPVVYEDVALEKKDSEKDIIDDYDDPLYNEIVEFAIQTGKISASLIQRRFKLGYNRAARIVDLLEERGIIGPQNGSKPRAVKIKVESDI